MMKLSRFVWTLLALAGTWLLTSCVYHAGPVQANAFPSLALADIENRTPEPEAAIALVKAFHEQLGTRAAFSRRKADARHLLQLRILEIASRGIASAEVRDTKDRDSKENAYQTVLFRIEMTVQYTILERTDDGKFQALTPPVTGKVTGRGDLPLMHDRNLPLQNAIRVAANDAARQIAETLSDREADATP